MNMQTFQIMILLLDAFIKLAPWRVVTEAMGRIRYEFCESLVRGVRLTIPAIVGLCVIAIASISGPVFAVGCFVGVIPPHVSRGGLVLSYAVSGFYLGAMVWGALWLRSRRHLLPLAI